jgi:Secretion system C-terminal sorting domain
MMIFDCFAATRSPATNGIFVLNSPDNTIKCNSLLSNDKGIVFAGLCNMQDSLKGNYFSNNDIGLHLLGGSFPTIIGAQRYCGNVWENSNREDARNDFDVFQSPFTVNNDVPLGGNLNLLPPNVTQGWFYDRSLDSNYTSCMGTFGNSQAVCDAALSSFAGRMSSTDGVDGVLAEGDIPLSNYEEELNWKGDKYLYDKLQENPSLIVNDSDMEDFVDEKEDESIGQFNALDKQIQAELQTDVLLAQSIESKKNQLNTAQQQYDLLKAQYYQETDPAVQEQIKLQLEVLSNQMAQNYEEVSDIKDQVAAQVATHATSIKQENSTIAVSEVYEINQKVVNDAYLTTMKDELEESSINELRSIAHQCPLMGGNAVFHARTLLAKYSREVYDDKGACIVYGIQLRGTKQSDIGKVILSPNPTSDITRLEWEKVINDDASIVITDMIGQSMRLLPISLKQRWSIVDVSDFVSGVYTISIKRSNGEILFLDKLVIVPR